MFTILKICGKLESLAMRYIVVVYACSPMPISLVMHCHRNQFLVCIWRCTALTQFFPCRDASTKQGAVAFSTPEAEVVAANEGYRIVSIPALTLWDCIAPKLLLPIFHEDNQA